jgi:hypothetical protein
MRGMQCAKRIGRVGRSPAPDLEIGHGEALVARDRQPAELQPDLGPRVVGDLLVGRRGDRDQQDLVEPELVVGLLRGQQMREMRRVEGPAEDADAAVRDGRARLPARRT